MDGHYTTFIVKKKVTSLTDKFQNEKKGGIVCSYRNT